jgi:hypothetical protein
MDFPVRNLISYPARVLARGEKTKNAEKNEG